MKEYLVIVTLFAMFS